MASILYVPNVRADFCPIIVGSDSSSQLSDRGETNCVLVISSGKTVSTSGSVAVSISGNGTTLLNNGILMSDRVDRTVLIEASGVASITNNGEIKPTVGVAIQNNGTLTTFNNSSTGIVSSITMHSFNNGGPITNFINKGTISALNSYSGIQNAPSQTIATLTNNGAITGGPSTQDIKNYGTITTMNNGQGGNSATPSATALKFAANLPTNYRIIVSSPTRYGQLALVAPVGSMTFGIYGGGVDGVPASTLAVGTYSSVLTNIPSAKIAGSKSGTYGSYDWSLSNVSTDTWDLIVIPAGSGGGGGGGSGGGGGGDSGSGGSGSSGGGSVPANSTVSISSGTTTSISSVGSGARPVFDGGTLLLAPGVVSSQAFTVTSAGGTITAPTTGKAQLLGAFTGDGRLVFNGSGMTIMSGANTYTSGTTVASGALAVSGDSPLGAGDVVVNSGAVLMGTGTIQGPVSVDGVLKPGHSPGYLAANSTVTMKTGSEYWQDIAGMQQASAASPTGSTGYYSFMSILNGSLIIQPAAVLTPRLQNLFDSDEPGYGSAPYVPKLGDQFRILTAAGGISGRFSSLTQPDGMSAGTRFVSFYNMNNSSSIDLAVIPSSYPSTIASGSGNKNAQSVGAALDRIAQANLFATSTTAQDQLLYSISSQNSPAGIASYAQSLAGEVYAAAVATIAQTAQRVQQAVMSRLGDTMGLGLSNLLNNPAGNSSLMSNSSTAISGGAPGPSVSSNPSVHPVTDGNAFSNGNVWGELAYQKLNRSSDSNSGGWNSNLYQLVFGSDFYSNNGLKIGGGLALSNTTLNPTYGSGTIQQGSVFAYGKMPVQEYVVDAMASVGLNSSDLSRSDITSLSNGYRNKTILGNDAMVSLGVSRPIDIDGIRVTPFARATWQIVTQSTVNEGDTASALSVNRYTGNGVRGVLGVAAGSKETNPMTESYTYRAYVGVGANSSGLLNPTLNASLAGMGTNITTPNAGAAFVQAGLYGTAKIADNAYAYAGISGEARSGQTLGAVNVGVRIAF